MTRNELGRFSEYLGELGKKLCPSEFVLIFSLRLDETGTDGGSEYVAVGGAVATKEQWDRLEGAWEHRLSGKASAYHHKEYMQREEEFAGWGSLKRTNFERGLDKAIDNNVAFRATIGVHSATHADIKERMRGISGFRADSDYSLCLRSLMFLASEQLEKIDPDFQLSVLVEQGPWADGAMATYSKVAGNWKPAKHAHRLAGFLALPKGETRTLEAADRIVGLEHDRLVSGRPVIQNKRPTLAHLLTKEFLEAWYQGMIDEKEHRRAFHRSKRRGD